MYTEEIIEEGIVISASNGYAEVLLNKNRNCSECAASVLCKPKDNNYSTIKVIDPFNTKPGDYIKISVSGKSILKTSILIYGISLILFLVGMFAAYFLLKDFRYAEIISFFSGLLTAYIYLIILKKKRTTYLYPKIICIKK